MYLFEFGAWHDLPFDSKKITRLKAYLNTVWQNRHLFYNASLPNTVQQRMFDFDGHQIKARNYVGFVRFEGHDIYVLPKVFNCLTPPPPKVCFDHVLYYLSYSQRVRFPFALARTHTSPSLFLPEICIFLFASYAEQLLIEQPLHLYQERTEELDFLKGQLDIDQYLKENIATGNWQKLHSRHTPLLYNNRFNQLVKYTARQLLLMTQYAPSLEHLQHMIALLQNVSDVPMTYKDCMKIRLPEQQIALQTVVDMCAMFLGNEMINYEVGQKYNFAFLLPMELVYEDFIGQFVQTHFAQWQPRLQPKKYLGRNPTGKPVFSVQPDMLLGSPQVIADTKYKIREVPLRHSQTAIEESDIYQMIAYALGYRCSEMVLLYPASYRQPKTLSFSESFNIQSDLLTTPLRIRAESLDITTTAQTKFAEALEQKLKKQLQRIFESH
ncbi:McrC family protein [Microscilla marina]|uniref:Restriction endonuclease n=1 Tax=Microscilla marina ATCC 23134 TaxID=313606 RepID=A1ZU11_MICM2|nr:hypothetical protein [Microscilla marina]EAY26124.1 conserved hypothetical protein [Microscilla marina ATCC 23134]